MNTNSNRQSATIYQFPIKDRAVATDTRRVENVPASYLDAARICDAAIDGAWYHDEAIRADQQARDAVAPLMFPRQ